MGRKKKKVDNTVFCWYCDRDFADEETCVQHQRAKHFKCPWCSKRLYTAPGLKIHAMQVHKEDITEVPNSLPGRESVDIEIFGMSGVPDDALQEWQARRGGSSKKLKTEATQPAPAPSNPVHPTLPAQPMGVPTQGMPPMPMPGMFPGPMPGMPGMPGMMRPPGFGGPFMGAGPPRGPMFPPMGGQFPPPASSAMMPPPHSSGLMPPPHSNSGLMPPNSGLMPPPNFPSQPPQQPLQQPLHQPSQPPPQAGIPQVPPPIPTSAPTPVPAPTQKDDTKIVHPPDLNLSIEETRARLGRYRVL
eukprot:m.335938 g.335938  ORF g.335938 m.335938 type:complete len:301 (-) comp17714_c0_seq1:114-1016(-)